MTPLLYVVYVAVRHGGWRLSEVVGRMPGLKYPAVAQGVKRIEARRVRDAACERFIRRLHDKMSNVDFAEKLQNPR